MQVQQKFFLHFLQSILLQPPFFSIAVEQFGQSLVFATIQLAVSEKPMHFLFHCLIIWHLDKRDWTSGSGQAIGQDLTTYLTGSWLSSEHPKQNSCPQSHLTDLAEETATLTALLQSRPGQNAKRLLH